MELEFNNAQKLVEDHVKTIQRAKKCPFKYSCGPKSIIFLVSRSLTQNITDFCPRLYIVTHMYRYFNVQI